MQTQVINLINRALKLRTDEKMKVELRKENKIRYDSLTGKKIEDVNYWLYVDDKATALFMDNKQAQANAELIVKLLNEVQSA